MTLDDLIAYGANVEEGMSRCMNNESFYLKLVESIKQERGFDELEQAVADGRLKDAFEIAHALKGVLGNLSLTPLYDPMCEITERLRDQGEADCTELLDNITLQRERLAAL